MKVDNQKLLWTMIAPDPIAVIKDMPIFLLGKPNTLGFTYGTPGKNPGEFNLLSVHTDYSFWDKRGEKTNFRGESHAGDRHTNPEATDSGIGMLGRIFIFPTPLPESLQKGIQISSFLPSFGSTYLQAGFFCKTGKKTFLNLIIFSHSVEFCEKTQQPERGSKITGEKKSESPLKELETGKLAVAPIDVTHPSHKTDLSKLLLFAGDNHLGVATYHFGEQPDKDDREGPSPTPVLSGVSLMLKNPQRWEKPEMIRRPIIALIEFPISALLDEKTMYPIPVTYWGNLP